MDITPLIKEGTNIITSYGNLGFSINKTRYEGSLLLLPSLIIPAPSLSIEVIDPSIIDLIIEHKAQIELLLIGCGTNHRHTPPFLKQLLYPYGIACDTMTTGAACRTFNVLLSEERKVAALLIAID
jgi:uncharacterized protein